MSNPIYKTWYKETTYVQGELCKLTGSAEATIETLMRAVESLEAQLGDKDDLDTRFARIDAEVARHSAARFIERKTKMFANMWEEAENFAREEV